MKKLLCIALCALLFLVSICGCTKEKGEDIAWSNLILGDKLPTPALTKGEIQTNDSTCLEVDVFNATKEDSNQYIADCTKAGFSIDPKTSGGTHYAYNADGYKLSVSFFDYYKKITIKLDSPMNMSENAWPVSANSAAIPTPKSTYGKVEWETDKGFFYYAGNMTKDDYAAYISEIQNAGYNINYNKGADFFYGSNAEGYKVDVRYIGFNIVQIKLTGPEKTPAQTPDTDNTPEQPDQSANNELGANFKAAMDSYESFIDEYVTFMKKYIASNGTDMSLLSDYSKYINKYSELMAAFNTWEGEDLTAAEAAYYIEVQGRVSQKLLEVAP